MNENDTEKPGYGKPPRQNRFQPGRSGNRAGRPKGSRNRSTIIREQFLYGKIGLHFGQDEYLEAVIRMMDQEINRLTRAMRSTEKMMNRLKKSIVCYRK